MNQSNFLEQLTLEQFKAKFNVPSIKVIANPKKGGSLFVAFGNMTAHLSKSFDRTKEAVMSLVKREDNDEPIWVLHNPSAANVQYEL